MPLTNCTLQSRSFAWLLGPVAIHMVFTGLKVGFTVTFLPVEADLMRWCNFGKYIYSQPNHILNPLLTRGRNGNAGSINEPYRHAQLLEGT